MSPLARGVNVALTREVPNLRTALVSLQWRATDPVVEADFTHMAVLCDSSGAALSENDVVFFNQMVPSNDSVQYVADPQAGRGVEEIEVDLASVPEAVHKIVFIGYLNEAMSKNRTLGRLNSCTVSVYDVDSGSRLVSSEDLAPALDSEKALVLAELYRRGPTEWKFKVVGQGFSQGLTGVARQYRLSL